MNDTGTFVGGAVMMVIMGFGLILAIYWLIFPLIVISKCNAVLKQLWEANAHLAVACHQLTIANRNSAPPVINPEQTLHETLHEPPPD